MTHAARRLQHDRVKGDSARRPASSTETPSQTQNAHAGGSTATGTSFRRVSALAPIVVAVQITASSRALSSAKVLAAGVLNRLRVAVAYGRRHWRLFTLATIVWVVLSAVVPSVAHRNAFPTVDPGTYADPTLVDCGRWPDRDCVDRRDVYASQFALAQGDDFISSVTSQMTVRPGETVPGIAALVKGLHDLRGFPPTSPTIDCFRDGYLAASYKHAQDRGTIAAFRAFMRLATSVPKANPVVKVPLKTGKALSIRHGFLDGYESQQHVKNLRDALVSCGPF